MSATRILLVNKSANFLKVKYRKIYASEFKELEVKNKLLLKLAPDRYTMFIYYDCRSVNLKLKSKAKVTVEEVPALCNKLVSGKKLVFSSNGDRMKIVCREKMSVAEIVSGNNTQ